MSIAPSRPVLRYHGGKWRLAPWIISHFPAHRVYVEPFGGSAAVLLQKPRCTTEVYNDLDAAVVNLFRVIRERTEDLARALALTPYARDEYATLFEPSDDPVEAARRFIARSFMGMNSKGVFQKSGFDVRVNADHCVARLRSLAAAPEEMASVASRFTHVIIESRDAVEVMKAFDRPETLHYVDPPYVPQTRSGKMYRHDMTAADHKTLAKELKALKGMVVLSGYPSPLYDKLFSKWTRVETAGRTDHAAGKSTECLWLNAAAVERGAIRQPCMFAVVPEARSQEASP